MSLLNAVVLRQHSQLANLAADRLDGKVFRFHCRSSLPLERDHAGPVIILLRLPDQGQLIIDNQVVFVTTAPEGERPGGT